MSKPQHLVVVLAMEQKTVLVCVGLSRRPISFSSEDGVSDAEKLRGRILESLSDVINDGDLLLIQVSTLVFYIHIYYCILKSTFKKIFFKLKLAEQALWGKHGAVTGKQVQPIWNVLTSKCIHGMAVSHTKTTCAAPVIQQFS